MFTPIVIADFINRIPAGRTAHGSVMLSSRGYRARGVTGMRKQIDSLAAM
jgi:hypothetical protein